MSLLKGRRYGSTAAVLCVLIAFLVLLSLYACKPQTPQAVVEQFLRAADLREARLYTLNRNDGALLEHTKHNLFQTNGNYQILRTERIDSRRVAVWVKGVEIAGFVDATEECAFRVERTHNGWKIDLGATLLDPQMKFAASKQTRLERRKLLKALKALRVSIRKFRKLEGRYPSSLAELKTKGIGIVVEECCGYRFELVHTTTQPRIRAIPKRTELKPFEMSLIGKIEYLEE